VFKGRGVQKRIGVVFKGKEKEESGGEEWRRRVEVKRR
jgi:hypothetical protein